MLRAEGMRIRYVNFGRNPEAHPDISKYDALIVYGGWMGVYEAEKYPHIKIECQLIEQALRLQKPVLGICLGAQILAHTLGAKVRKHSCLEVGWQEIEVLPGAHGDKLFTNFMQKEMLFQMHGDTFDLPQGTVHLARSEVCEHQAFSWNGHAYGLQFHLETEFSMIRRFLHDPQARKEVEDFAGVDAVKAIAEQSAKYLARSNALSLSTFRSFLELIGHEAGRPRLVSLHGKE